MQAEGEDVVVVVEDWPIPPIQPLDHTAEPTRTTRDAAPR